MCILNNFQSPYDLMGLQLGFQESIFCSMFQMDLQNLLKFSFERTKWFCMCKFIVILDSQLCVVQLKWLRCHMTLDKSSNKLERIRI
jgi:hypothetical protein